jgi:ABC-type polysaccharide/polyol phosphate export permease
MRNEAIATPEPIPPMYCIEPEANVWRDWTKLATLVKHLARRSLAVRYRGSALGFVWSLINPILLMGVYTFVFRFVFRTEVPGIPYSAFFLTGILAWNSVSIGAMSSAVSLLEGNALVKKVAFPRVALPLGAVVANAVNYVITIPILLLFNFFFGIHPSLSLLLLPFALTLMMLIALGTGLLLATLIPRFRDLQHLAEVLFVSWFLLSPVLYPMSEVANKLSETQLFVYTLNPMVGAMQLVHAAFFQQSLTWSALVNAIVAAICLFTVGLWAFQKGAPHISEL